MNEIWKRRAKRGGLAIGAIAFLLVVAVFLFVGFGWGAARGLIEDRLSTRLHRRVTIGAIHRVGWPSLNPVIEIERLTVAQPEWAGKGMMVQLRRGRIRLPVLPLLVGRIKPQAILVEGAEVALVVDSVGRENWHDTERRASGSNPIELGDTAVRNTNISYADAKRDVRIRARLDSDSARFSLVGGGVVRGAPARLALTGPPVTGNGRWPFHLSITSAVASLIVDGHTATPLDVGHLDGKARAWGHDLQDLDRLIQAGLPASQEFALTATIVHDRPAWRLRDLAGRIGRSDIAGRVDIDKKDGRTVLTGGLVANRLDFDDLSSDAGLAKSAALARALGPRLFPATPIRLDKLRNTDGRMTFEARTLLFKQPSPFRAVKGVASLDHGVLTVSDVVARLTHGRLTGSAIVGHPDGAPRLNLDLTLTGARLESTFTDAAMATGMVRGRLRLAGTGDTVRAAIGRASGRIGLVATNGAMDRRNALFAAADVGRALFAKAGEKEALRCLIAGFAVSNGVAHPDPLVLDTAVGRSDGTGAIRLADETLALSLAGRSRMGAGLKVDRPFGVAGTIERPQVVVPRELGKAGNILKMLGRAIAGEQPAAPPVDCTALAGRALR